MSRKEPKSNRNRYFLLLIKRKLKQSSENNQALSVAIKFSPYTQLKLFH